MPATQPPSVVLQDPNAHEDAPLILDEQRFASAWTGDVLLFKRDYNLRDEDQPFGIWLLVSQLLRDRKIARDIGIAALTLSLLAIAPIMFWRLLIDRVLYYGSLDTFAVLCIAMLVLVGFETAFGYLRRYLVLHVTQRVDAKLSTYMFDKVLNLPIDFLRAHARRRDHPRHERDASHPQFSHRAVVRHRARRRWCWSSSCRSCSSSARC